MSGFVEKVRCVRCFGFVGTKTISRDSKHERLLCSCECGEKWELFIVVSEVCE